MLNHVIKIPLQCVGTGDDSQGSHYRANQWYLRWRIGVHFQRGKGVVIRLKCGRPDRGPQWVTCLVSASLPACQRPFLQIQKKDLVHNSRYKRLNVSSQPTPFILFQWVKVVAPVVFNFPSTLIRYINKTCRLASCAQRYRSMIFIPKLIKCAN